MIPLANYWKYWIIENWVKIYAMNLPNPHRRSISASGASNQLLPA
tara:strand:+ start:335 stop:469 length:135 start_codon:yes stop_codon:yes gene_type:complete